MAGPIRWGIRSAALLLVLVAGLDALRLELVRSELERDTSLLALRPELSAALRREDDAETAVLLWARAGAEDALDLSRLAGLPAAEAEREAATVSERLQLVERRAGAIATRSPWRGDAWLALGTAELLRQYREIGPSAEGRARWRPMLERALALGGGDPAPRRILALAWLSEWSVLPDHEREDGLVAIGAALADPALFRVVLPAWLAANARERPEMALSIVPDRAATWELVASWWLGRERLSRAIEAWQRRDAALAAEARATLLHAERLIAGGAARRARSELVSVLALPPSRQHAVLFVEAARAFPGGAPDPAIARHLERWLEWAIELAVHGRPALPGDVLHRFGVAVDPILGAAATALAGDISGARSLARRGDPHRAGADRRELLRLAFASALLERGLASEALAELGELPRERRDSPEARRLELRALGTSPTPVTAPRPSDQAAFAWRSRGPRLLLDLDAPPEATIELELTGAPGTVLELSIDGEQSLELGAGHRVIRRSLPAEGGPTLVWLAARRGSVRPPVVRVLGGDGAPGG